jgi:teichuronic acid biosynthesis glycosyltransferase TuaC
MISRLLTLEHTDPDARVLMVTNMWPRDGDARYGIFVKRQVDSLIKEGLRCDVLFIRGYRSPLAYVLAALTLFAWNWLPGRRYALVHCHGGETALAARFYLRAPVLASYMGTDLLGKPRAEGTVPLRHRVRRWLVRRHARFLTATVTMSREMDGVLPSRARASNTVIPQGVDPSAFRPIARDEARRTLGWDESERVALFVADPAVERKRYWLAEAGCELAKEQIEDLQLRVAANVPPDEVPIRMSAADCLLLTSTYEGSPNVVKEAMMCNLPVVATAAGDVAELLSQVDPSFVCDATPESVASGLLRCLSQPTRSNGRAASAHLGWLPLARRMLAAYVELAPDVLER